MELGPGGGGDRRESMGRLASLLATFGCKLLPMLVYPVNISTTRYSIIKPQSKYDYAAAIQKVKICYSGYLKRKYQTNIDVCAGTRNYVGVRRVAKEL